MGNNNDIRNICGKIVINKIKHFLTTFYFQTSYKGGGYTFTFKRTLQRTQSVLEVLEKQEWLDVLTRGVFVEFTLYNANANLFGSVIMLMEQLATGGSIAKAEVKVTRVKHSSSTHVTFRHHEGHSFNSIQCIMITG